MKRFDLKGTIYLFLRKDNGVKLQRSNNIIDYNQQKKDVKAHSILTKYKRRGDRHV